ncbi:MAG: hypothetical protein KAJ10_09770 [Thermodesulfovibrionia bacterium]|nr:hypothetical protein [Thermodesulfovibrionia bacterium]
MQTSQNNIEKSLHSLAFLIGIELRRGWKTELAGWFGVPLSLLSNWINRNALPKERMKYIEDREYSREQWYDDTHKPDKEAEDKDMWTPTKETLVKYPVLKHLLQYAADDDEEGFSACIALEDKKRSAHAGEPEEVKKGTN